MRVMCVRANEHLCEISMCEWAKSAMCVRVYELLSTHIPHNLEYACVCDYLCRLNRWYFYWETMYSKKKYFFFAWWLAEKTKPSWNNIKYIWIWWIKMKFIVAQCSRCAIKAFYFPFQSHSFYFQDCCRENRGHQAIKGCWYYRRIAFTRICLCVL